jgi:alanine racemase
MEGLFYPDEVALAAEHQFTLVVHHQPCLEMLEKAVDVKPFPVWMKINTGMNRLGFDPVEANDVYQRLKRLNVTQKPIGLMTHFAEADSTDVEATTRQIAIFRKAIQKIEGPVSLANSAGILGWPEAHGDWVRPGLILYGASPYAEKVGIDHGLTPVMTLWSRIITIKQIKKGEKIGYGGTWSAPDDMRIGVVGVGYGDGYPQYAKSGTPVLVNGKECALVGRVSMDMLMVDLRNCQDAAIGDPVILWGAGLPVERVARMSNTSAYEILTRMTPRPKIEIKN